MLFHLSKLGHKMMNMGFKNERFLKEIDKEGHKIIYLLFLTTYNFLKICCCLAQSKENSLCKEERNHMDKEKFSRQTFNFLTSKSEDV